jgi:hypothetical protein
MPSKDSKMIRVPRALWRELHAEAAAILRAHVEGKLSLPNKYCENVPLHYVIKRWGDEARAHRERSRRPKRRGRVGPVLDRRTDARKPGDVGVYPARLEAEPGASG